MRNLTHPPMNCCFKPYFCSQFVGMDGGMGMRILDLWVVEVCRKQNDDEILGLGEWSFGSSPAMREKLFQKVKGFVEITIKISISGCLFLK